MRTTYSFLKRLFLPVIVMIALQAHSASAQMISHGDLFGPGAPPPMIGVELGVGKHTQQGDYNAACGCTFTDGSGTGFMGNLVFELPLDYDWAIGIKAGIDFKNTTGTTVVVDTAVIQFPSQQREDTIGDLTLNRNGYIKTTYLSIAPFVQYQFFRMGPFVQAGLNIGILIANHFTHHRELLSDVATTVDGLPITDLRFSSTGTREEIVEDDPITDVNKLRLGALLSAGYNLSVSERSVLTPMLTYDFPLTTLRTTNANGWKIGSLYGSVVLKFKLD